MGGLNEFRPSGVRGFLRGILQRRGGVAGHRDMNPISITSKEREKDSFLL